MEDETVDSILVKEGRVEHAFLFPSNCFIHIAVLFLEQNHNSIHIKNI